MSRRQFDVLLVASLFLAGVLAYPWALRTYHFRLLASPNPEQANASSAALVMIGPAAAPGLIRRAREWDLPGPRHLAMETLLKIEDERALPLLLDIAAGDWDHELRRLAMQILSLNKVPGGGPVLANAVPHWDDRIRFEAVAGLHNYPEAVPTSRIIDRLDDAKPAIAAAAASLLARRTGLQRPWPRESTEAAQAVRTASVAAWRAWQATEPAGTGAAVEAPPRQSIPHPPAPDFALTGLDGSTITLRQFRGRPVLINFWASWCPPCIAETADLIKTAATLGDDAVVLGLTAEFKNDIPARQVLEQRGVEATPEAIAQLQTAAAHNFVQQHRVSYPVAFTDVATLEAYGAFKLPTTVIVRPDGTIHGRLISERTADVFIAGLRSAAQTAE